jgi:tetrahydromethanopterin S-methyltransferase subunit F
MDNTMKNGGTQKKLNGKMIGIILAVIIVLVLVILAFNL